MKYEAIEVEAELVGQGKVPALLLGYVKEHGERWPVVSRRDVADDLYLVHPSRVTFKNEKE